MQGSRPEGLEGVGRSAEVFSTHERLRNRRSASAIPFECEQHDGLTRRALPRRIARLPDAAAEDRRAAHGLEDISALHRAPRQVTRTWCSLPGSASQFIPCSSKHQNPASRTRCMNNMTPDPRRRVRNPDGLVMTFLQRSASDKRLRIRDRMQQHGRGGERDCRQSGHHERRQGIRRQASPVTKGAVQEVHALFHRVVPRVAGNGNDRSCGGPVSADRAGAT